MIGILFYDLRFTYTGNGQVIRDTDKKVMKLPQFDNEDELSEWLAEQEQEIGKEIITRDAAHRDDAWVKITNIVRM